MKQIEKIKLFVSNDSKSQKLKEKLLLLLDKYHFIISDENFDLAIAIGGDGTFIKMVHDLNFNDQIYYIGINTGTLGFLQEVIPSQIEEFVKKIALNQLKTEEIGCQETEIITKTGGHQVYSLNEIVIRDYKFKTTHLMVYVDSELLEEYAGDGLLIATTVGSTAYNASLGGAMVNSKMHTIQITPIAPLVNRVYKSLRNSLIVPANTIITIEPSYKRTNDLLVMVDGSSEVYMDVIHVTTSIKGKKLKCLKFGQSSLAQNIREKFLK